MERKGSSWEHFKNSPKWLMHNIQYLVKMGSHAYGTDSPDSDLDIYGFAVPPKNIIFPHLAGHINGFGTPPEKFDQWQTQIDSCDYSVYNIVRYFELCRGNNPNMIDSLFVPDDCILRISKTGHLVRENRIHFLSKLVWPKFKGYAQSQLSKIYTKNPIGKRKELVDKFGYDCKFASHSIRLLLEAKQIFTDGTLNLRKNKKVLREIKTGKWTLVKVTNYFYEQIQVCEEEYSKCTLPDKPNEEFLKNLLVECLEIQYGSNK